MMMLTLTGKNPEPEVIHVYKSETGSLQESQYYDPELEFLGAAAVYDIENNFLPQESAHYRYYGDNDYDWEEEEEYYLTTSDSGYAT